MNKVYVSLNGDKIGSALGQHILNDDIESLSQFSQKIDSAVKQICQAAEEMGGRTIICSGDEALLEVDENFLEHLYDAIDHFKEVTGFGCTVGIGQSVSEASKALIYGKLNDVGYVTQYHPELEKELKQFDESPKERQMGDDYDDEENVESPEISGDNSEAFMDDESGYRDSESEESQDNDMSEEEGYSGDSQQSSDGEYEDDGVLPESSELDGGLDEDNDEFIEEDEGMDEEEIPEQEESEEMPEERELQDEDMSDEMSEEIPLEEDEEKYSEEDTEEAPMEEDMSEEEVPMEEDMSEEEVPMEEGDDDISDLSEEDLMGEENNEEEMPLEDDKVEYYDDEQEEEDDDDEMLVHEEEGKQEPIEEIDDKGILSQMMDAAQDGGADKQALKEKVLGILQRFKQDKHIIEQAKDSNPAHYQNIMEMLNSMIEMARHLVDSSEKVPQMEEQQAEMPQDQQSIMPEDLSTPPKM